MTALSSYHSGYVRPWNIVTEQGTWHSNYATEAAARRAVVGLNERAQKMGLVTRFAVKRHRG